MNDDDVRALVREAIQKHLGPTSLAGSSSSFVGTSTSGTVVASGTLGTAGTLEPVMLSFSRYKVQRVSDDGMCLIEPAVRCNQCGYCECHGH